MLGAWLSPRIPIRLCQIVGYEGRINDVVYCRSLESTQSSSLVVYFGGDVQDFTENMLSHRDNKNYAIWNLENTAQLLQLHFKNSNILIIRPVRMELKTFSCFDNFVPSSKCGAPKHADNNFALQHLDMLINNVAEKLHSISDGELKTVVELTQASIISENLDKSTETKIDVANLPPWERSKLDLDSCDIQLIGFSKGCVVLNQLLHEFHYWRTKLPKDSGQPKIMAKIKDMYWLDGGHCGGKNTWITSQSILKTFASLGINIHVHVTPYQIEDDRRPWIRKEEKQFNDILRRNKAAIERVFHFENISPCLSVHFDILKVFKCN